LGDADKVRYRYALRSGQGLIAPRLSKSGTDRCKAVFENPVQAARSISIAETFYQIAAPIVMIHGLDRIKRLCLHSGSNLLTPETHNGQRCG